MNIHPNLFISYRRSDSPGTAGRLYDHLIVKFQEPHVFKDINSIPLGDNFIDIIERNIEKCDIFIVVIGKSIFSASDEKGAVKIFKEDDVVALEIYTAFNLNKTIIPVLVDGADMPAREVLPARLKFLSLLNGFTLSHDKWKSDVALLIERIENKISDQEKELIKKNTPPPPTPKADKVEQPKIIYEKAVPLTTPYRRFDSAANSFSSINLSQNAGYLLIGHKNGQLDLVDTKDFTLLQSLQTDGGQIRCADLSNDGKWVAVGKDKTFFGPAPATLWDLVKKQKVKNLALNRRTDNINFSADGKMVAATGFSTFTSEKSVLFQADTGETLTLGYHDRVFFTMDGKIIVGFHTSYRRGGDW
ncbi:toll/interleukin-1 receptor domain-containing protein [Haliscomenobacter sp.]|uniref:toll/interleukin-1 receptor domain-containing protein n=1 Tax=Haliscomenobacter sp. TaxID=2717303 RepID=UPI003BAA9C09